MLRFAIGMGLYLAAFSVFCLFFDQLSTAFRCRKYKAESRVAWHSTMAGIWLLTGIVFTVLLVKASQRPW